MGLAGTGHQSFNVAYTLLLSLHSERDRDRAHYRKLVKNYMDVSIPTDSLDC